MPEDKDIFQTLSRVGSTENAIPPLSQPATPTRRSSGIESDTTQVQDFADPEKGQTAVETVVSRTQEKDPNLVDWNGPDDPEKPLNWPKKKKWTNMMLIAALTLLTPFGSSMFAPGVPKMMEEFHSSSVDLASFVVSIYVLG